MTQYDDPQMNILNGPETASPDAVPANSPVKVYERPARTTPVWLLILFVVLALATLWFLFAFVF